MSDPADEQLSPKAIQGQRELERWAAESTTSWGKPREDDYDFQSWIKDASKELLQAGRVYEYAREAHKLRCLLALIKRKREAVPSSFEGLREEDARDRLGGALYWLTGFADQLADNTSFAELLRTSRKEVKRSLVKRPLRFPFEAVQLALPFVDDAPPPWPWRHLFDAWTSEFSKEGFPIFKLPDRHIGNDGSETIAIEIRWGYFTNKEISEEMRKFACAHRPGNEACKEPKRKGQRPKAVIQSHLKALSVMRIWKLHNRNQWKRLKLVAKNCDYEGCARESEEYERRRRRAHGNQPMSDDAKVEMSKARAHALSFFQRLFPWEMSSNY